MYVILPKILPYNIFVKNELNINKYYKHKNIIAIISV